MRLTKRASEALNVTRGALYQKLNGVEIEVSAALVRETARELEQLIQHIGGQQPPLLPGYQVRIQGWQCIERNRTPIECPAVGGSRSPAWKISGGA